MTELTCMNARRRLNRSSLLAMILALVVLIGIPSAAYGHAGLKEADPAEDAVVTAPLREIHLEFAEPIEVRFSTIKVYPLPPEKDELKLMAAASKLVSNVLRKLGDEKDRADAGLAETKRTPNKVEVLLKEDLKPGAYVVMWRVLSVDTHVTQGFYVFTYKPAL